ncbi:MAG: hypothetical protein J6S85_03285 [Methanobrevibacter sp.]|nr:hypothetical protein [Methanobrevibacter sp.]
MKTTNNGNYIKVVAKEGCVLTYKGMTFNECVVPIDFDLNQIKETNQE